MPQLQKQKTIIQKSREKRGGREREQSGVFVLLCGGGGGV